MPFDPKGVATQILNERLGGDGEHQGENSGSDEYDGNGLTEAWKDLIEAIHSRDHVAASGIHRNILSMLESQPHEEAEEEEDSDSGFAHGGIALGGGKLSAFSSPEGGRLSGMPYKGR